MSKFAFNITRQQANTASNRNHVVDWNSFFSHNILLQKSIWSLLFKPCSINCITFYLDFILQAIFMYKNL